MAIRKEFPGTIYANVNTALPIDAATFCYSHKHDHDGQCAGCEESGDTNCDGSMSERMGCTSCTKSQRVCKWHAKDKGFPGAIYALFNRVELKGSGRRSVAARKAIGGVAVKKVGEDIAAKKNERHPKALLKARMTGKAKTNLGKENNKKKFKLKTLSA